MSKTKLAKKNVQLATVQTEIKLDLGGGGQFSNEVSKGSKSLAEWAKRKAA